MPTQHWQGGSLPTEWWLRHTSPCTSSGRGTLLLNDNNILSLKRLNLLLQTLIFIGYAIIIIHVDVLPPFHHYVKINDCLLCLAYKKH